MFTLNLLILPALATLGRLFELDGGDAGDGGSPGPLHRNGVTDQPDLPTLAGKFQRDFTEAAPLGPKASTLYRRVTEAGAAAIVAADKTTGEVKRWREDDLVPREARDKRVREALDTGRRSVTQALETAGVGVEALRRQLEADALPKLTPEREAFAREDARLLLDQARGPAEVLSVMLELAKDPDSDVAALILGRFGERYLRSRGIDAKTHRSIVVEALQTAVQSHSGSESRLAAAKSLAALSELEKSRQVMTTELDMRLGELDRGR